MDTEVIKRDSIVTIHDQLVAHFSQQISSGKGTYVAPLVSRETGLMGYIGQSLTEGTSSELFSHLSATLEERKSVKWHLLVCSAENSLERQLDFVATLMDHGVQGILFTPAVFENPLKNRSTLVALEESGVPLVLVDRGVDGTEADSVVNDQFKAGYIGTEHLIRLGHERIALVDNPHSPAIVELDRGHRAALEHHGLAYSSNLTLRRSEIPDRMETILAQGATALLGHSDFAARDALSWCARNGVEVPGRMAIVGVGDLRHAQGPEPVLTTVRKDFKRMEGRRGSERRHETIDVELLVRSTCGGGQTDHPGSKP